MGLGSTPPEGAPPPPGTDIESDQADASCPLPISQQLRKTSECGQPPITLGGVPTQSEGDSTFLPVVFPRAQLALQPLGQRPEGSARSQATAHSVACRTVDIETSNTPQAGLVEASFPSKSTMSGVKLASSWASSVSLSQPHCRICYEHVSQRGLDTGAALHLGCACAAEHAYMHAACARDWFGSRPNTLCEVCGKDAKGLPADMRGKMTRNMEEFRSRRFAEHSQAEGLAKQYVLGAMLPAVASCVALSVGLHVLGGAPLLHAMAAAVVLALSTLPHWLMCGHLTVHVAFVVLLVVTTCALASILRAARLHPGFALLIAAMGGYGMATGLVASAVAVHAYRLESSKGRQ